LRVHGDVTIRRRFEVKSKGDYSNYLEELREDFHDMCGYCGKSYRVIKNGFEIDHFVPQKQAEELKIEYSNLVYLCHTCNRKKHDKWPTNDTNTHHNEIAGFVDPATNEYDLHIERKEDGNIKLITKVGEYMCETFQFSQRPIEVIWKCERIFELQEELENRISQLTFEDCKKYIEINVEVKKMLCSLFENKE
jgi:uncharacterized protein (TIGR02646 family)